MTVCRIWVRDAKRSEKHTNEHFHRIVNNYKMRSKYATGVGQCDATGVNDRDATGVEYPKQGGEERCNNLPEVR